MNVKMMFGTILQLKVSQSALIECQKKVKALEDQEDVETAKL